MGHRLGTLFAVEAESEKMTKGNEVSMSQTAIEIKACVVAETVVVEQGSLTIS